MNEFARILSEIIEQGKKEKNGLKIKDLAQQADITASYLSNMKQGNKKPPTQKTLLKLANALRRFKVSETKIQRLIEAYNREQLDEQKEDHLLQLLADEYAKKGELFTRIKESVNRRTIVPEMLPEQITGPLPNLSDGELFEGDRRTLLLASFQLLKQVREFEPQGGRIYITWSQHSFEDDVQQEMTLLGDLLRGLLWVNSPFQVFHLWAGDATKETSVIVHFLTHYIGASNCFLYTIPGGQRLTEYLVVEHVGFIEARPVSENRYWMRTVLSKTSDNTGSDELHVLIEHLEYLIGPETSRKPLVQTEISPKKYTPGPAIQQLANAELKGTREERLQIKATFSSIYTPVEVLRTKLGALRLARDRMTSFLDVHHTRVKALKERLEHGRERSIHEKAALRKDFYTFLAGSHTGNQVVLQAEASVLQKQIVHVLHAIKNNSRFHFALVDHSLPLKCRLAGDTASFAFALPRKELPSKQNILIAMTWTAHPDILYQTRNSFYALWNGIAPQWRTDTDEGRKNVINFIVAESLKALLKANVPTEYLYSFASELVDATAGLDFETYIQELYTQEQVAKEMFLVQDNLPTITMPVDIGPWESRDPIRTRQRLLFALMRYIENFHLISTQVGIEEYRKTGKFGVYTFNKDWINQHLQYSHDLFLEFHDKITLETIPSAERILVNFLVIDREFVAFENSQTYGEQSGIIIQDKELAQELITYFERNLSAKCPEHLKGAKNVARWFEEQFGVQKT